MPFVFGFAPQPCSRCHQKFELTELRAERLDEKHFDLICGSCDD